MRSVANWCWRHAAPMAAAVLVLLYAVASPAQAFDLFAAHEVTVQFATPDGKPMADVEVRVFAPGEPNRPYTTGRTDADGRFVFAADRDGFWSAEARSGSEVARVSIRVGAKTEQHGRLSPILVFGGLGVFLVIAVWYRMLRARTRRPKV
jgi:hypothetical protein